MNDQTITLLYKTDTPNANGHIYPKEVVRKAFEEYSKKIENNMALGVLGQKTPFDPKEYARQNIEYISHSITNIEEQLEGFNITAKVLKTPKGKDLSELIDNKTEIRFGLRGIGRIEDKKVTEFKLIAVDILKKDE
jgi:hypothetical protein